ncbi:MAG TPA: hypothetical protein PLS95_02765 [Thermoanaerobaculales bacterium]|nr:hypothetical protein [Thermoanaerobaculales bacterium]HQN96721.1 hypothetical protein [Thermoanaerobaculales bacterium]
MDDELITVFLAQGEVEEAQVRLFLEAHGIPAAGRGEALRKTHGFVLDGLGAVAIQVAAEHAERARDLLGAVERGDLNLAADALPEDAEPG